MVAADAAALHAMSYPAVVVRHDMIDGIRALQLAFGAAPMAICHLCADTLFAGELDTVDCVSGNNMIHLKCAMVSFAAERLDASRTRFMYHQPVPAGKPVSRSVRGKHYGTSLRQHARIGISTVLSAHITVALHPLHPTTRSTSPALSELPESSSSP